MNQKDIRPYNGRQYSVTEGSEIIEELDKRTKSHGEYNSIQRIGEKIEEHDGLIQGAVSGYRGTIKISDTPTENGIYTPTESGTYPNAGGLIYAPDGADKGKVVQFIKDADGWEKNIVDVGFDSTELESKMSNLIGNPFTVKGVYINSAGAEIQNNAYNATPFIPFDTTRAFKIKGRGSTGASVLLAFYNENKSFLSSIFGTQYNNVLTTIEPIDIPSGAVYLRATCNADVGGYLDAVSLGESYAEFRFIEKKIDNQKNEFNNKLDNIIGAVFTLKDKYIDFQGAEKSISGATSTDFIAFDRNKPIKIKGRGNASTSIIAFYDKDGVFISGIGGTQYNNVLTTIESANIPQDAVLLRATCNTADGGILEAGFVIGASNYAKKAVDNIQSQIDTLVGNLFSIEGYYINRELGEQRPFPDASCTPFIRINRDKSIEVKGRSNNAVALIAFYNKSKEFISAIYGTENNEVLRVIQPNEIPEGATYIRCSCTTANGGYLKVELISGIINELGSATTAASSSEIVNVTLAYPLNSGFHTPSSARSAIPIDKRKTGMILVYAVNSKEWIRESYISNDLSQWVRDELWESLSQNKIQEVLTELDGNENIRINIDGKQKGVAVRDLHRYIEKAKHGFPKETDTLFFPGEIDTIAGKWKDKSGNGNDADLVSSNCGLATSSTIMRFSTLLQGNIEDWSISNGGTAVPLLLPDGIRFTSGGTVFDVRIKNTTINKEHYYPVSEGTMMAFDCSGNSNHITIEGVNYLTWVSGKQNIFHYNLNKGGGIINDTDIIENPKFQGTYVDGLAPGYGKYQTTSVSEETTITIHGKAQKVTATIGGAITTPMAVKKYRKGDIIKTTAKVYVLSGKVNCYAISSVDMVDVNLGSSKSTNKWEEIVSYALVRDMKDAPGNIYSRAVGGSATWIIGEIKTEIISETVSVPALENGINDALGRAIAIPQKSIFKVETAVKFPPKTELIGADVENYLFTAGVPNEIKMSNTRLARINMVYENRIFANPESEQFFIFGRNLNKEQLKSLLQKWSKNPIQIFREPGEYSLFNSRQVDVRDINRNFRVGIDNTDKLCVSNDYGKTWSAGIDYDRTAGIHHIFITSKGSVIIFYFKSVVKRMAWGENSLTRIYPVDENGSPIIMHTPVNPEWPGEYYKPYHKMLDMYDPSDGSSLIAWGSWNNNAGSNGAAPQALFYSIDDCATIRRFYYFGKNPNFSDKGTSNATGGSGTQLGNPDNPLYCRHIHELSYNPFDGKIYATCGDSSQKELQILELKYNKSSDTWDTPITLVTDVGRNQIHRAIGIGFDAEGYWYFGSDADFIPFTWNDVTYDTQGVFRIKKEHLNDISKAELLHPANDIVVSSFMHNDLFMFSVTGATHIIYVSRDKGKNWESFDIREYTKKAYPYNGEEDVKGVSTFKMDDRGNIHAVCGTGVYLNILEK